MASLSLRSYQIECLEAIETLHSQGMNRQLISLPTGAGKTVIFANLIKRRNCRALVLAHTIELLQQSKEKIEMVCPGLDIGIINSNSKEFNKKVVISSIQSARIPENLKQLQEQEFELLIYDECHRAVSDSAKLVIESLGFAKDTPKLFTGFTATAFRNDGKGLAEIFDIVAYQKKIKDMINDGYLCQPSGIKVTTNIDLSKVKFGDGDFEAESLAQVMDTDEISQIIVDSYIEKGEGRQTLCFGVTVQHAHNLAQKFRQQNVSSQTIHGGMSKAERETILKDYRNGQIRVLCNCMVLTEGFDAPETACIIVARPTQSKGLFQQMAGRGLRLFPNKKNCLILDLCTTNHSLCSTATLVEDAEVEDNRDRLGDNRKEIIEKFPTNLNQKLKSALRTFDPLSDSFTWAKKDSIYVLRGGGHTRLGIVPSGEDRFRVVLANEKDHRIIAEGLNFEYAFATAEEFARENRAAFIVCDRSASWRDLPASDKQISLIRSKTRCKAGLGKLTRGQAADLIGGLINE